MANRLGMSRSELFSVAMSEYIEAHKYQDVTESLNKVYSQSVERLDEELELMQLKSILKEEW
ncbi:MAG: hypothetical protein V3U75_07440 [Methylococcaceae bacterium]